MKRATTLPHWALSGSGIAYPTLCLRSSSAETRQGALGLEEVMPIFDDILIFAYAAGDTETEAIADYETGGRIFEKQNKEKRNTRAKDAELTII